MHLFPHDPACAAPPCASWPSLMQEVVPAAAATDEGPDLSCLDHAYFLAEVSRLVSRAEAVRARLYRDNMNCGRTGSVASERSIAGLAEVLVRLESYRLGLGGDHPAPFEAELLLHGEGASLFHRGAADSLVLQDAVCCCVDCLARMLRKFL